MNSKGTTKSGGRKHELDKFYTKPDVAKHLLARFDFSKFDAVIEPSAGSGSFSDQIPDCIAMDSSPENPRIMKKDFFTYSRAPKSDSIEEDVLVIGNPPFGQQNNLAIRFINHATTFATTVAFILPVSFKKASVQSRINRHFHLVHQEDLPEDSFSLNGNDYAVKTVFQVWEKRTTPRPLSELEMSTENHLFTYVKKSESPDAAIQRIGGNAGKATTSFESKSENSNYFVKFKRSLKQAELEATISALNSIEHASRNFSVGPRSISKFEMNFAINRHFKN